MALAWATEGEKMPHLNARFARLSADTYSTRQAEAQSGFDPSNARPISVQCSGFSSPQTESIPVTVLASAAGFGSLVGTLVGMGHRGVICLGMFPVVHDSRCDCVSTFPDCVLARSPVLHQSVYRAVPLWSVMTEGLGIECGGVTVTVQLLVGSDLLLVFI